MYCAYFCALSIKRVWFLRNRETVWSPWRAALCPLGTWVSGGADPAAQYETGLTWRPTLLLRASHASAHPALCSEATASGFHPEMGSCITLGTFLEDGTLCFAFILLISNLSPSLSTSRLEAEVILGKQNHRRMLAYLPGGKTTLDRPHCHLFPTSKTCSKLFL